MAEDTKIKWASSTFNPWMGCVKISEGCRNCYAEKQTTRYGRTGLWGANAKRQVTSIKYWNQPAKWNREAERDGTSPRVFCGSLCDVFEDHPTANAKRPELWELIQSTPRLTWLMLTKRPENICGFLPDDWGEGYPNVWLGTTVESDAEGHRSGHLFAQPAAKRFISYEPAIGPLVEMPLTGLDWLIYGGESGPGHRDHDVQWARDIRERCRQNGVAFFYKQSSGHKPGMDPQLDGETIQEFPVMQV